MNNLNKLFIAFILLCCLLFTHSCVKDDDYSIPPVDCTGLSKTMSFAEFIAKIDASKLPNNLVYFTENDVIEGYVISSDETGNFYKSFSIQEDPSNPLTKGIQVEIDQTDLYTKYPEGSLVQIQLNGLVAGYDRGVLKIGSTYISEVNGEERVGRLAELLASTRIKKTCDPIQFIAPRVYNSISEALKPTNVNTLVTIKNVEFENPSIDRTYGDAVGETIVNRKLIDKKGKTVDLRNSGYATWADELLPTLSGEITAVVSIYNGTYQLYIRDLLDVRFDEARFEPGLVEQPSKNAIFPFLGADFNDWSAFLKSTGTNTSGNIFVNPSIVKEKIGQGINNSTALGLDGQVSANGPVFIVRPTGVNLPIKPTKLHFWLKGNSSKSLTIYVYKRDGTNYVFNVGSLSTNKLILENSGGGNSYIGVIDTSNEWRLVQLDLEGLNDINTTDITKNFLAFRVGNNANYELLIDNISIE